jgi:adenosylmethionine-8-amino-7-oxononanoate aminotransferase
MKEQELLDDDARYIWHPLTQHKTAMAPKAIASASGNYLYDFQGNRYFDAISSWYTCSYGHANKALTEAIKQQVDKLHHVVFAGMTHEPATVLAKKLIGILPYNQAKVFYSENGSTSVEIAVKMAFQYHFNRGEKRNVIIALENGFHGDTFGAMSVSGLSVYNGPFEDLLIEVLRVPAPTANNIEAVLVQVADMLKENKVASFIYEPLVQGAAAMQLNDATALCQLLRIFKLHGVLNIADEVMTGFGKTGTLFASDQLLNKPDIMCLSKALTGGIMPMAVTSTTQEVYDAFYKDELAAGFFHGHTYSGNPLGCAVASAAIDLLTSKEIQESCKRIAASHSAFVEKLTQNKNVENVRAIGVILAFDLVMSMERYGSQRNKIFNWFWEHGIFLRPLGNTIYIVPPFTTTTAELDMLYDTILRFLDSEVLA